VYVYVWREKRRDEKQGAAFAVLSKKINNKKGEGRDRHGRKKRHVFSF